MPNFFEFLSHTADIQVHAVGDTLAQMVEQTVLGMMNVMTSAETVKAEVSRTTEISAPDLEILIVLSFLEYVSPMLKVYWSWTEFLVTNLYQSKWIDHIVSLSVL